MNVTRYAEAEIPTEHGPFRLLVYRTIPADAAGARTIPAGARTIPADAPANAPAEEHMAIVRGDLPHTNVLVRVHSECWTSEVMGSLKCDCREQLEAGMERIAQEGVGVIIYLRQEGRGIGLGNKVRAYALQSEGADTVEANLRLGFDADARRYDVAAAILEDLGVKSVRLLTNNPLKVAGLQRENVTVTERLPIWVGENAHNRTYLAVKRRKMGHHPVPAVKVHAIGSARKA